MKWMKKAISLSLAIVIFAAAWTQAGALGAYYLPDVDASMSEPSFWTQNSAPQMSVDEICKRNTQTVKASGTNMYDLKEHAKTVDGVSLNEALKKSAQADAAYYLGWTYLQEQNLATQADFDAIIQNTQNPNASREQKVRYGIAVKRTALRAFPSDLAIWDDLSDTDFDYQYLVGVRVNEPVVIVSVSKDGKFYLAKNVCCSGWIPVEDVAVCRNKSQWLSAWDISPENALVVCDDRVYTETSVVGAQTSALMLSMGTVLQLAEEIDPNALVDNRAAYNNYVVWMPVRNEDGFYDKKLTLISEHNAVSVGYLPLTEQNIAKVALSALGNVYGWGGSLNSEDCSSYIRNIYKCFGLELARNTTWQTAMPMGKVDLRNMCREERMAVLDAMPVGTILFFSGHEMLYLGQSGGRYYVVSAVGSIMRPGKDSEKQRIRSIVLNTLDIKRANGKTWMDELTDALVPYWSADAEQLPQKMWYHEAVAYCRKNGLMTDDENGMFRPMDTITVTELLQILLSKENPETEQKTLQGRRNNKAAAWAKNNGLIFEEDGFDLDAPMNRQQMATVLYRYAQHRQMDVSVGKNTDLSIFADVNEISEQSMAAMQYAVGAGLLNGKTKSTVNPSDLLTRAESAAVLQRFMQSMAE
ncbi:MAG: SH3 domain-containing protein [Oscillospiraceae bacterium]|nr:SH3 domain-containing protein [Oscillospiraceae bacterium]